MTDSYFVAKAREVFARAGGDPANAGALAEWAEEAKKIGDAKRGVIVAEDGQIIAATRYVAEPGIGASYVIKADSDRLGLFGNEVGLALGQIRQQVSQRVIHVTMPEVTRGAGARVPDLADPLEAVRRAARESRRMAEESRRADAALEAAAVTAHQSGVSPTDLAKAADVARTTIYRWIKQA